jgi:hypothetical protein
MACPSRSLCLHALVGAVISLEILAAPHDDAPKRLKIKNACRREPIWIAHQAGAAVGVDVQNVRIAPGDTFHFSTPPKLSATRFWPKTGCDEDGSNCSLGSSGGPGQTCTECAPPVDTKFEGTFDTGGWDYVDMSLVDGWTLPFRLDITGGECHGQKGASKSLHIDCSDLNFHHHCPSEEYITTAGLSVDLRAVHPRTKQVVGCYSPCAKLTFNNWGNNASKGRSFADKEVSPYCCPTPPETPETCRRGPITATSFLKSVHARCPGVYGYAYDDGVGLLQCTTTSVYEVTFFCPEGPTLAASGGATWARDTASHQVGKEQDSNSTDSPAGSNRSSREPRSAPAPSKVKSSPGSASSHLTEGSKVWVVSDPEDALFERVVPEHLTKDNDSMIVRQGGHGIVRWQKALHAVDRVTVSAKDTDCGDARSPKPCKVSLRSHSPSWAGMIVRRSEALRLTGLEGMPQTPFAVFVSASLLAASALSVTLCVQWLRRRQTPHASPTDSAFSRLMATEEAGATDTECGGI